ncbi:TraB/GumN family protein [Euryhalocaulis caribicus]|uniref:TraB/GumN family protein n=1 Tax=Euryhalocaulis caribicus TaxID=1161401 RepID=UPI0013774C8C|nr:TraB/GumN family protein [Euryhalocaulis caribicus]
MRKAVLGAIGAAATIIMGGAAHAEPAIWKASDADSEIWLFGSVHLLNEDSVWRTDILETALSEADLFYYEVPLDAEAQAEIQALVQQRGLNGEGETLNGYLTDEQAALLEEIAPSVGLTAAQMQPMKPWLANLTLGVMAIQKAGYNPQSGVEMKLIAETPDARERFLETPEEQIMILSGGSDEVQAGALQATLEQLRDDPDLFDRMVAAWENGDAEALDTLMVDSMKDVDPAIYEALIVRRNAAWVEDIKALMEGDEDALVTVGAGHLVGEGGVPALLQAEGYTVERVQ